MRQREGRSQTGVLCANLKAESAAAGFIKFPDAAHGIAKGQTQQVVARDDQKDIGAGLKDVLGIDGHARHYRERQHWRLGGKPAED